MRFVKNANAEETTKGGHRGDGSHVRKHVARQNAYEAGTAEENVKEFPFSGKASKEENAYTQYQEQGFVEVLKKDSSVESALVDEHAIKGPRSVKR